MRPCKHTHIGVRVEGGMAITYCTECGKILDTKPVDNGKKEKSPWAEGFMQDNGGQILHDDMPIYCSQNTQILHD